MPEMDALSLSISASTKQAEDKINSLIRTLKGLDTAFRSLTGSTVYANNLETAVHAITRVNNAISNINATHIADVAKSMKALGKAGGSLAAFGITETGQAMDNTSSKAKNLADALAKTWNIKDKGAINDLTASIQKMIDTMGRGDEYYKAESNVTKIIEEFSRFDNQLKGTMDIYNKVRETLRKNPLYIPENFSSNADWLSNKATIGVLNTTSDINKGISAGQLKSELEGLIPALQNLSNESDIINTIAEYLKNNATPAMVDFNTAVDQGTVPITASVQAVRELAQALGVILPTAQQLKDVEQSIDYSKFADMDDAWIAETEAIQQFRDQLQPTIQEIDRLAESNQKIKDVQPFETLVTGLESLQGVDLPSFANITVLADGVNRLGYQSAVTAAQILPQISEGLHSFDGVVLPNIEGMDSFVQGIRSLGSKAVQNAANALPFVAQGLQQLSTIVFPDMTNLTTFTQALSVFGRKTSERAIANVPKLAQSFNQLFQSLSKVPTISRNTIDAANAMANLANKTGSVTSALNRATPSLNAWGKSAKNTAQHTFSLASAIGKVYATYWMLFRAFGLIRKSIDIASDLTEVRNVVIHAFDDMAYKANAFSKTAGDLFGMSKLQSLDAASRYQAMGKTMGITNDMVIKANDRLRDSLSDTLSIDYVKKAYGDLGDTAADMSLNLTKLAGDLASLYNTDIEVAAEKLNSIFTGTTKPLREFGFDLTQANLKEWALTNGINANIKEMTQAEKAVLRYEYVMANAGFVLGDFVRTADSWHNVIVKLKLAFKNLGSVIGQGFINLLKPAIQKITAFVNTLTGLIQKALNAIGKLLGWQIEIDPVAPMDSSLGEGVDSAEDMADSMEDTEDAAGGTAKNMKKSADAAKKMKDYLLGIDELNVFRPDDDSDSGSNKGGKGGSGNTGTRGGANGGAKGGDVGFRKYESDISSWFQLGDKIGDAISDALEKIDWNKIYKKAEHFGTGLASFLNGLITPRLFYNLGKTIANSLNTALHFLDSFGKHFDWKNFGSSIAAGINGFFENFDFKLLASTLNTWALGLLDTIIVALQRTDWEMIGTKIGEFLVNVKWMEIAKKVAKVIWQALNAAFKVYKGMFKTAPLETAILSLVGAFKLIYTLKTATWFKNLSKVVATFNTEMTKGNGIIAATNAAFPVMGSSLSRLGQLFKIGSTSVGVFSTSMSNGLGLMTSMQAGFGTLVSGVNAFSASLSPLAKIIGGAFGAFVEFFTVSDGVKNLITGMQNLGTSIGEIAIGVGIASTAFSLVFGIPAGLIVTAIVGVVAAIKGINDAFNEIKADDVGNKIKNALIQPGGVPLEEVIGETITSLSEMGNEFELLANKSENLNSVDSNIRDIESEITLLERQLATGVITQEEYTTQVSDAYARMATAITTKIGDAETYIAGALGEGSPIAEALEQEGINVKKVTDETILKGDELLKRAVDITTQLASLDPNSEEYRNLKKELESIAIQEDETAKASQALDTSLQKSLNWEKFIDAKTGELEADSIKGILGEVTAKAEDVKTSAETSMNGVVIAMKNAGNEAGADEVQNAIPGALDRINANVATKCTDIADTMQRDAIDKITKIMDDAGKTWETMDYGEKALYDFNKAEYQKQMVDGYKTNVIDPLSKSIETEYGELGIEGAGWAEEASKEIVNAMFSDSVVGNEEGPQTYITTLSDTWKNSIDQASNLTYDTAVKDGEYVGMGIGDGIVKADTDTPISDFFRNLWNSFAKIFQSHSPAKAMYPMGENIMSGIIEGFKQKYSDITKTISDWFEKNVKPLFTIDKWKTLGSNMGNAIITKWNEFKTQWTTSINNWWNQNVKPWFTLEKWKAEADHIRDAIKNRWDATVSQWITDIANWWNQHIVSWFKLEKWKAEADHIRDAVITKLGDMVTEWATKISNWWDNHVKPWFELKTWQDLANNIKKAILGAIDDTIKEWSTKIQKLVDSFGDVFKESKFKEIGKKAIDAVVEGFKSLDIASALSSWANGVKDWLKNLFTIKPTVETSETQASTKTTQTTTTKKKSKKASGGIFDSGRWHNVHAYGTGGMPMEGQLFWAREKGPELVGQIGGNTAVINNDQIVASVAAGVQQAVTEALAPYLADISENTRETANKDYTVRIGDREIAEANNRGQRSLGAVLFS